MLAVRAMQSDCVRFSLLRLLERKTRGKRAERRDLKKRQQCPVFATKDDSAAMHKAR